MPFDLPLDGLITPVEGASPSGSNLEYDPDFMALEVATRDTESEPADWPEARRLCEALLERTRDLRLAVYYTRALLRTEGFKSIHFGLSLIKGLLENHWDSLHPELDADDDNDPTMRVNALAPLVANEAVVADLRASILLRSRQSGVLTVRDIEVSQGKLTLRAGDTALTEGQVEGMMSEALAGDPDLRVAIAESVALLNQISNFLTDKVGAGASLDIRPLHASLHCVQQVLKKLPDAQGAADTDGEAGESAAGEAGNAQAVAAPGQLRNRQDVIETIERLVTFLERNEPTNPAQWLLKRAQRVMNMNFLEAIVELAPEGLDQAERMVGGQLPRDDD